MTRLLLIVHDYDVTGSGTLKYYMIGYTLHGVLSEYECMYCISTLNCEKTKIISHC